MKFLKYLSVVLLALTLSLPCVAQDARTQYVNSVYNAVTLLYSQDEEGGMVMHCTATAYKKLDKGYRFVTASHCVPGETEEEQQEIKYYVTSDSTGAKTYIPAKLIKASDKESGEDFAIFEVDTDVVFSVVPLGDNTQLHLGSPVLDVASPLGLGKQLFTGYVSNLKLDRPKLDAQEIKWSDVMLVFIGSGPGSSGSAIVSDDQKAIVGFLVGGFESNIGAIVVPVSKFKDFESKVDAGTYKTDEQKELKNFFDHLKGGR